jgi:hypothetical protein
MSDHSTISAEGAITSAQCPWPQFSNGKHTQFGFEWDNVAVERLAEAKGAHILRIACGANKIEVYVSPTGRTIRVFDRHGRELSA